jgi:uncharacterized FlaG/YvyC family protein
MRVEGVPQQDTTEVAAVAARLRELATSARLERPTLSPGNGKGRRIDTFETANETDLRRFAEALENVTRRLNSEVRLDVDDDTGRVIAQIIDRDSREIIRQVPPEELLHIAARLNDLVGLLFDAEG